MTPDDTMSHATCPPKAETQDQSAPEDQEVGGDSCWTINGLLPSCLAVIVALFFLLERWRIPAFVAATLAFGLATVWVNAAFLRSSRSGGSPPRWLAKLERLRQYLANEGDEPRTTATARR